MTYGVDGSTFWASVVLEGVVQAKPDGVVRVGGETGASDQTGGVLVSATVMRDDGTAWISLGPEDVAGIFRIDGCW